jgi:hypothetical protein
MPFYGIQNILITTILDPILLSKFSKSVGDILVTFLYCPLMYWDSCSISVPTQTYFLYSSVRHQRRGFLFLLFKLAIIKAAKLTTTTTSREDITTKAWTELPFARFKLSSPTGRGRLVAETITMSDLRTAHKRLHYRSARKCIRTWHEMSSPAWTLGSWVRIPLETCLFVCVYSVFALSCVGSGLATGWSHVQGVLPIVYKCKIMAPHKRRPRPDMGWSAIKEEEELHIK